MDFDYIIIGSGVAGALVADYLTKAQKKVLILEAGPSAPERQSMLERFYANAIKTPESAYPMSKYAPTPLTAAINDYYDQTGPVSFSSTYERIEGGSTWHWLGTCLRLLPSDFSMRSLYNTGIDWPISYNDLAVYYDKAEQELQVSGPKGRDLHSPRSSLEYPAKEFPSTYLDNYVAKKLSTHSYKGFPLIVNPNPQARDPKVCLGSHSCVPICPTGAKYEAIVHLQKAIDQGAVLRTKAVVEKLRASKKGKIEEVIYYSWEGKSPRKLKVKGKNIILALGGIETAKLLLNSKSSEFPEGLANLSDQVGRNLMDHPIQLSYAETIDPIYPYRGPLSTSGVDSIRDGVFRKDYSASRLEIHNSGFSWPNGGPQRLAEELISLGYRGKELKEKIANACERHLLLTGLTEQLPLAQNRVTLSGKKDALGIPRPQIYYELSDYDQKGLLEAQKIRQEVFNILSTKNITHDNQIYGAGHIMGTVRMGLDVQSSCVDINLRSHQHENMYVVGSSVFPTGGSANPTLTIAALSIRLAEFLIKHG